jgi:hypothetical protein
MIRAGMLIAGLAVTQIAAAAADINYPALVQRLPAALPSDASAALKTQTAGLAAMQALAQDVRNASAQVNAEQASRIYAGTSLDPGTSDPAEQQKRMQAMAAQMQGMSPQQQIAMAMKMQQQVQSNMGVQAAAIAPSEQQAVTTLAQDPRRSNQLMQSNMLLVQKVQDLRQAADAQHQQIQAALDKAITTTQNVTLHGDAECAALSRKQKQLRVDAFNKQVAVSNNLLTQLQPIYTEYRKRANDELQHLNSDIALAAQIKNGAMQKQAAQTVATARGATLSSVQTGSEFYKQAFDETRWASQRDQAVAEQPANACAGGGG